MKKLSPKDLLSDLVKEISTISERMSEQENSYKDRIAKLESENIEYHTRNRELSKDLSESRIKSSSTLECLKTKEKQLERYKSILNLTPGTDITKVKLLEYFTNEVIPHISNKIGSKYTEKIIEYLDKEILNKEESTDEERRELHDLALGTDLEFLCPYFISGYIKIDSKTLKSHIKNPTSLAYYNWKKSKLPSVLTRWGNMSCPIYSNVDIGIHNIVAFNESCLDDIFRYILDKYNHDFVTHAREHLTEILDSTKLRKEYGLSLKEDTLDIEQNIKAKRDIVIKYLSKKGLL
jgi:hypothetical protein